jgi:hypothetical protein
LGHALAHWRYIQLHRFAEPCVRILEQVCDPPQGVTRPPHRLARRSQRQAASVCRHCAPRLRP